MKPSSVLVYSAECPLLEGVRSHLVSLLDYLAEPWRSQALECVTVDGVFSSTTVAICALDENSTLSGATLLSLPDVSLLGGWKHWAYLSNVIVEPSRRGRGVGKSLVKAGLELARTSPARGRVLLASGDPQVRRGLYAPLGFSAIAGDEYLMQYAAQLPPDSYELARPMTPDSFTCRKASHHDLATVQSICAQDHWVMGPHEPTRCGAYEVEEKFSARYCPRPPIGDWLGRVSHDGVVCVGWYHSRDDRCELRLLSTDGDAKMVVRAAESIAHCAAINSY
jgi:predicted N-acetyltransferase YhbS